MRLIDADELRKCAIPCEIHNGALTDLCVPLYQIDNAPTVEAKIADKETEKAIEILTNYEKTACDNCFLRPCGVRCELLNAVRFAIKYMQSKTIAKLEQQENTKGGENNG